MSTKTLEKPMTTAVDEIGVKRLVALSTKDTEWQQSLKDANPETVEAAIAKLESQKKPPAAKLKLLRARLEPAQAEPPADEPEAIAAEPEPSMPQPRKAVQGFRFVCDQADLAEHLPLLSRIAANTGIHPVLQHILMEAEGDRLVMTAFNLSTAIQVAVKGMVHQPGKLCAPAKLLEQLVLQLPSEQVTLQHDPDSNRLLVTSSAGVHQMLGMSDDEYPALPQFSSQPIELPVKLLQQALMYTEFSTSHDESKQVLCGVNFEFHEREIHAASTDGHRLSHWQGAVEYRLSAPQSANFHYRMLPDLRKLMANSESARLQFDQEIKMQDELLPTSGYARFEMSSGNLLICRLIDGQYPNYRQLIPNSFLRTVLVDRKQFIASIQRVAIFASNQVVKMEFDPIKKTVHLHAAESENAGDEDLTISMTGDELTIAFDSAYLLDALRVLDVEQVALNMNTPTAPVLLRTDNFQHIVMPVQCRG
jgi:DNA polymerase III subunit beta